MKSMDYRESYVSRKTNVGKLSSKGRLVMKRTRLLILSCVLAMGITFGAAEGPAAAAAWYNCQALDVFEFSNGGQPLLMVECSNSYSPGVNWTAVQLSGTGAVSSSQAGRFAAMAQAAVLSGRKFRVFMTDMACPNNSNCMIASSWSLYQ